MSEKPNACLKKNRDPWFVLPVCISKHLWILYIDSCFLNSTIFFHMVKAGFISVLLYINILHLSYASFIHANRLGLTFKRNF